MIFISSPYSHADKSIVQRRYIDTCKYAAWLISHKLTAVSPVIFGHNLLEHEKLPSDFAFWKTYSYEMLAACKVLHVLMIDGWDESAGVQAEIARARELNMSVQFVVVEDTVKVERTYRVS